MASVIWKYGPLNFDSLPVCGKPIKLDIQSADLAGLCNDQMYCWCLVDLDKDGNPIDSWKNVRVVGTGENFVGRYIDTVQNKYGLVWHLIEE